MVKRLFAAAAFALLTAGAYAQVTVSAGFALSSTNSASVSYSGRTYDGNIEAEVGLGGNIYADYLLPIGIPLSLGFEFGVDGSKFTIKEGLQSWNESMTAIPLLLRAAYHFDLMSKLDLYLVGKLGYAIGVWEGDYKTMITNNNGTVGNVGGFAFGIDVGASYYFTQLAGAFIEAGFDDYMLEAKGTNGSGVSYTFKAPFYRFLTLGISLKF
jgi:hypothetical protein